MNIKKIIKGALVIAASSVVLTGCNQQKDSSKSSSVISRSKVSKSKSTRDLKQEKYDEAVKDKIKAGTYSYVKLKELYAGRPIHELKTSVGNFTIYEPELYGIAAPKNSKKDLIGFKFLFDYRNNTNQAQNGIKALESILKIKKLVLGKHDFAVNQLQVHLVTEPYRGMDENHKISETGRVANNEYLTPVQGMGKYIISFVTKTPSFKGKNKLDPTKDHVLLQFLADPKSKVELKTINLPIGMRID